MASMPVQLDEKTLIREAVAQIELPEGVRLPGIEAVENTFQCGKTLDRDEADVFLAALLFGARWSK